VIGLSTTVSYAGIPLGALIGGWAVSEYGLHRAVAVAGVLCLLATLAPLLGRQRWTAPAPVVQS
jgi:predicted MFS family arabinose efflux permease